ncbi:glyoxal reductase-like isoform X1 [Harmonia axyridis]|uniref:glyoxal reductase-like isoform X1 n=1 Tax=Harmonia axyridis TaxID=115357 RepID=UPI001E279428|nr:glyoxal reductase-like isoform X1 [Harmonia axyridis]XP_045461943.1 glyoxal reductase-like isoform X1 [Harmonia axyridis]
MDCSMMKFKLQSGKFMPLIGFGTYLITGNQLIYQVLDEALAAGYRHIDTATVYHNETSIGQALKVLLPKYNLKREDIFITSKLGKVFSAFYKFFFQIHRLNFLPAPIDQGEGAFSAVQESLKKLDCGYLDLYLIHWPGAGRLPVNSQENNKLRSKSWESLAKAVKAGLVKDIGVSNYTVKHLNELLMNDYGVKPSVNQVEWHPKFHQPELLNLCRQEGILLQAYSSLGGTGNSNLIRDPTVVQIAAQLQKTPAQVLLRWAVQQNIGIIPKARTEEHIKSNIDLNFEIPVEMMTRLSNLNSNEKFAWNPEVVA